MYNFYQSFIHNFLIFLLLFLIKIQNTINIQSVYFVTPFYWLFLAIKTLYQLKFIGLDIYLEWFVLTSLKIVINLKYVKKVIHMYKTHDMILPWWLDSKYLHRLDTRNTWLSCELPGKAALMLVNCPVKNKNRYKARYHFIIFVNEKSLLDGY
jgi:hypothetical protein